MKSTVLFFSLLISLFAWSDSRPFYDDSEYQIQSEIRYLTGEILEASQYGRLNRNELETVRNGLRDVLDSVRNGGGRPTYSEIICSKGSNGLFYPTNSRTGTILGSNSYSAGYSDLDSCRRTLPTGRDLLACFKQSNGLFYPSNVKNGTIVGSNSYSAGHSALETCKATLPRRNSRVACFKQSNGLYYPSSSENGQIIGSNSYSAGFSDLNSCLNVLNQ